MPHDTENKVYKCVKLPYNKSKYFFFFFGNLMYSWNYQTNTLVSVIIIILFIYRRRNIQCRCHANNSTWYRKVVELIIYKKKCLRSNGWIFTRREDSSVLIHWQENRWFTERKTCVLSLRQWTTSYTIALFYNMFIMILYMFRALYVHHQEAELYWCSIW